VSPSLLMMWYSKSACILFPIQGSGLDVIGLICKTLRFGKLAESYKNNVLALWQLNIIHYCMMPVCLRQDWAQFSLLAASIDSIKTCRYSQTTLSLCVLVYQCAHAQGQSGLHSWDGPVHGRCSHCSLLWNLMFLPHFQIQTVGHFPVQKQIS
jgi:hypothetical protein